ncbi:MAG: MBL fold metallo-hydrolase [Lachnospiraceae bacterium]|nr:MBL fold metallo-hydrolase [Lachnospiraceae bacterium]
MEIKVLASGSTGNCYLVSDGESPILLDAGIPIKRIRAGCDFRLTSISGCLVTHYHGDHSKAVKDLLAASVKVYMPAQEIAALGLPPHHRLHELPSKGPEPRTYETLHIGSFLVVPFRVEHDTPEPVGYLLRGKTGEKLLYFTDTFFVRYRFFGVTHIIGEVNYDRDTMWEKVDSGETPAARAKRLFSSHMSLDNFLDFLRANDTSKLQQVYICHMSDDHGNEAETREVVQRLTGAEVYIC